MRRVHIAAISVNQTPLAWSENRDRILSALKEAKSRGAQFVCFPELCLSGYGCEDAFFSPNTLERAEKALLDLVPATEGLVAIIGLPLLVGSCLYNTAAVISNGTILGFVAKQNLAGDGIHYEPRWFKPWPKGVVGEVQFGGDSYPVGDLVFECDGVRFGLEICEDAWVAERVGISLSERGVDIIFNPSASHFAFYKRDVRRRIVLDGSRAFGVSYVYTNLLGNEAGRAIYDGSAMISSLGQNLIEGKRFSFAEFQITEALVDVERDRLSRRKRFDTHQDGAGSGYSLVSDISSLGEPDAKKTLPVHKEKWEESSSIKEEEFARAVTLGLFDYIRKSASRGVVVSLSGGADSSAICCLVSLLVSFGVKELGKEVFLRRLGRADVLTSAKSEKDIVRNILLAVYQGTKNSGPVTLNAAQKLSDALGADFRNVDVQGLVDSYTALASAAEGRPLEWSTDDIALQNIQARTRGPLVWFLANLRGFLLLSTSNRSEAAVGYATMDGDTCGGLSPIAGIDKAFLRRWLSWLETEGPEGIGKFPVLSFVNAQAPTAELRPSEKSQTDEADLMPYPVLDLIERWAIRDKRSPKEVLQLLGERFPDQDLALRTEWVKRFFLLWSRNQWKRERYAPSFHLDDANLDPKTWCRFPILSGGYKDELKEF